MAEKKWQITARSRTRQRLSRSPMTTGWLRPDTVPGTDLAVGVFSRQHLSDVLGKLHARGLGQTARVFDPARGELIGQLKRAGVTVDLGLLPLAADDVVVLVSAVGRAPMVGDLMLQANAKDVRVVSASARKASQQVSSVSESDDSLTVALDAEAAAQAGDSPT